MARIHPPTVKVWMLRNANIIETDAMSEMGIFSTVIYDSSKPFESMVMENRNTGTLLRTKGSHSNEGGVNAGYAVIDSPILYRAEDDKIGTTLVPNVNEL